MTADDIEGDGGTCPFVYCRAVIETRQEMRHPGPTAGSVTRITQHDIVGVFDFWGPCPSSLMALPLNDAAHVALSEIRRSIDRAHERREADREAQERRLGRPAAPGRQVPDIVRGGYRPDDGRNSREPRPDGRGWRGSTGGSNDRRR